MAEGRAGPFPFPNRWLPVVDDAIITMYAISMRECCCNNDPDPILTGSVILQAIFDFVHDKIFDYWDRKALPRMNRCYSSFVDYCQANLFGLTSSNLVRIYEKFHRKFTNPNRVGTCSADRLNAFSRSPVNISCTKLVLEGASLTRLRRPRASATATPSTQLRGRNPHRRPSHPHKPSLTTEYPCSERRHRRSGALTAVGALTAHAPISLRADCSERVLRVYLLYTLMYTCTLMYVNVSARLGADTFLSDGSERAVTLLSESTLACQPSLPRSFPSMGVRNTAYTLTYTATAVSAS